VTPSQKLLGSLLAIGEGGRDLYHRLKVRFPEFDEIPGMDATTKAAIEVLYTTGLCDFGSFDLRTQGRYHDALVQLIGVHDATDAHPGPGEPAGDPVHGDPGEALEAAKLEGDDALQELCREKDRATLLIDLTEASAKLAQGTASPAETAFELRGKLDKVAGSSGVQGWDDYVGEAELEMTSRAEGGPELTYGLIELDAKYNLHRGHMAINAGPTSHAKTAAALRLLLRGEERGLRGAALCFEDLRSIPWKLASIKKQVPMEWFTRYYAQSPENRAAAVDALTDVRLMTNIRIFPPMPLSDFEGQLKDWKPDIIILDYVQRYVECYFPETSKREGVGKTASDFQNIVQRHGAYGVLNCQVRRRENTKGGAGPPRRPGLSDLKESGDLENYADSVLLLWWPHRDRPDDADLDREDYRIEIAKDKLGPGGEVKLRFKGETMSIFDRFTMEAPR
jgi:hypothetical protein